MQQHHLYALIAFISSQNMSICVLADFNSPCYIFTHCFLNFTDSYQFSIIIIHAVKDDYFFDPNKPPKIPPTIAPALVPTPGTTLPT